MIRRNKTYKAFIKRYRIDFNKDTPAQDIREFFEKLVDMIGEDIIRNHLKIQLESINWDKEEHQIIEYERKIKMYQEKIKELQEGKNDKNK